MKIKWIGALVLLLAVPSVVGCGSDDSNGSAGAGLAACNAYCDAVVAKSCPGAADCKTDECEGLDKAPGACDTAFKNYYDCLKAQTDVCTQSSTCQLDLSKCQ